jgi:putative transposase
MSNPIPLEYGKYYHIYNRGNNRENIFFEDRNYRHFLKLYAKHVEPVADTYAYCLLYNHFHFLVRIKTVEEQQEDLTGFEGQDLTGFQNLSGLTRKPSQQFSNMFNAYTKAINKAYNRTGSLFQRPFGRIEVAFEEHFIHLITYIHQNPQKHGLVEDFRTWPYSSYHALLSSKPTRVKREVVLTWFDGLAGVRMSHRRMIFEHPLALEDFD